VSVQNNILSLNGYFSRSYCDPAVDGVEIGVYGDAVDTVVDSNESAGSKPLIANRAAVGAWEKVHRRLSPGLGHCVVAKMGFE
jgi:hypothetical protein